MRGSSKRTSRSASRLFAVALLVVLAVGVGAYAAFAASPPPAPSITASPASQTNSQLASFTYSDSASIQKFQCSLDAAAFADCGTTNPATKSPAYSGLTPGAHTFQVRAVSSGGTSSPTSYAWTIDLTPPHVVSINRVGASPTNAASVQWSVTFSEDVTGVDASDFALARTGSVSGGSIGVVAPSSGPASVYTVTSSTGTGDGTLGLNLVDNDSVKDRATNPLGGAGTSGAGNGSFTGVAYTIDKTGPANAPTITAGPAAGSSVASTSVSFSFSSAESGVAGFVCKLDAAAAAACTSAKTYSSLAQGSHAFSVWALDALGNAGPGATRSWTVDTVAPAAPSITAKPSSPSNQPAPSFSFTGEAGATFLCKLDSASFVACSSPQAYSGVAAGAHTFQVEAKDAAGNVGPTASYTWTVDLTSPAITVNFPTDGGVYSASGWNSGCAGGGAICGSATDPSGVTAGGVSVQQLATGKYWNGSSFSSSSEQFNSASLTSIGGSTYSGRYPLAVPPDGQYTVHVRATDGAGNQTPAGSPLSLSFRIDTTPPVAPTINSGPANPVSSHDATFAFSEPSEPSATFLCKLDSGAYVACASTKTYGSLADGSHTFQVEAVDTVGNVSAPKAYGWTVDTTPPPAPTISAKPANPTNQTGASFTFTDSQSGAAFLCKLDASAFAACSSPQAYSGLVAGPHTFQVEAKDAAGNVSSPTTYAWTIDLTAPTVTAINLADPSPTNAATVHWTVTFSEPVTGLATGNFSLAATGLSGSPVVTSVTGSGATYTVTASTGSGTPSGTGTLQLKLSSAGSAKDTAGNALSGLPFNGQTYTLDRLAPKVLSINRLDPSPTNAASVRWTVTFSEPVTGLVAGNFALSAAGLGGSPAVTGVTGSGTSYTVTASTGSSSTNSGSLQLRLTSAGAVKDAVGNVLSGLPFNGQTYSVDRLAPPPPTFAQHPLSASQSTSATFRFADDSDNDGDSGDGDDDDIAGATFVCSLDGAPFTACSNPITYTGLAQGGHTLKVEAVDLAGNFSTPATFTWFVDSVAPSTPVFTQTPANPTTITGSTTNVTFAWTSTDPSPGSGVAGYVCQLDSGTQFTCTTPRTFSVGLGSHTFKVTAFDAAGNFSGTVSYTWVVSNTVAAQPYTISGNAQGTLYPTTAATGAPINLTFNNPNAGNGGSGVNGVQIAGLTVTIASVTAPNATLAHPCGTVDFAVTQFSGASPFYIPQGTSSLQSLSFAQATWPTVRLLNRPVNQDGCKGATVNLTYTGHS